MGTKKKSEWTEYRIQRILKTHFLSFSTKKYEVFGKFIYDWESDYLTITKSGYAYEIEIKISRGDFKHDAKKQHKHLILEGKIDNYERPNYLYYAVPYNLIKPDEVPEHYGLIYVGEWGIEVVKVAPKLHEEKVNIEKLNLVDKFYYSMWEWRDRYEFSDIVALKSTIKQYTKDAAMYEKLIGDKDWEIANLKDEIKRLKDENNNNT